MKWFKQHQQTDKELQDELKALCEKVIVSQYSSFDDMSRYENLLREIYKRNLTPEAKLVPKK